MSIFVIAEAGVNHNGDPENAFKLIDIAIESSASAVKFQTFRSEELVTRFARTANYQKKSVGDTTQLDMLKKLELDSSIQIELSNYAKKNSIEFMTTAFDSKSLEFVTDNLGVKKLKISSGDITNIPFLIEHARHNLDIILSTGASNLYEVKEALSALAFGLISDKKDSICKDKIYEAFDSEEGQDAIKSKVTLMHCTSEYPAPVEELNLKAIRTLYQEFETSVGYSDHSTKIFIPSLAIAFGAKVIEKHFTIDKAMEGPDHSASLDSEELTKMIIMIKSAYKSLGSGEKQPQNSEIKNREVIRKSICASRKILSGDEYTHKNISIRRPGNGLPPNKIWEILGKKADRDYEEGEIING